MYLSLIMKILVFFIKDYQGKEHIFTLVLSSSDEVFLCVGKLGPNFCTQQTNACSESTIETLEEGVEYVQS